MEKLELIKKLSEINGISGFEKEVAKLFKKETEDYCEDYLYDNLGSIAAKIGNKSPKIMIAAHMDEIGFLVQKIDNDGFVFVHPIGGWWNHVLLAQRMVITTSTGKEIIGVFGVTPPHILAADARVKVVETKTLYLDIGVKNKKEALELGIQVGDPITPVSSFSTLGDKNYLVGKAFDDRIGLYAIIELIRSLKKENLNCEVFGVGTVQEEVGLRGAKTITNLIAPDIAFAIDVCLADDLPPPNANRRDSKLGTGVSIGVSDNSVIAHRGLLNVLIDLAKKKNIPFTLEVAPGGGTDSGEIHKALTGVINLTLSIPSRHIHSHNSIINMIDVDALISLLREFIIIADNKLLKTLKESKYK